jgi:predicted DNA-binding protein
VTSPARRAWTHIHTLVYTASMKRTNVYLREDQLRRLGVASKKSGAPAAELIRRAIDAYLKKK